MSTLDLKGSPVVVSHQQDDVSDIAATNEKPVSKPARQPGEQPPPIESPQQASKDSIISTSESVPELPSPRLLTALEDSQCADSSLALEHLASLDGRHLLESRRFSIPHEISQDDEQAYVFASAPKYSSNHFSGNRAAPMFHLQRAATPTSARESNNPTKWRRPENSSPYSVPEVALTATDGKRPPDCVDPCLKVHRATPSASKFLNNHSVSKKNCLRDDDHNHATPHADIGDLALPGEVRAKRPDNDAHQIRRGEVESFASRPHQERFSDLMVHRATIEQASRLIPESGQRPIDTRAKDDRRQHKSHAQHQSHDHSVIIPGSECSSTRPGSRVSNVSRRRHAREVPESPSRQMELNLRAIHNERHKLRDKLSKLRDAYESQEATLADATARISHGKEQMKHALEDRRNLEKAYEALQQENSNLLKRIKMAEIEANDLKSREQEAAKDLLASQATLADVKGQLKDRCKQFRQQLNQIMTEHQSLSVQSKQECKKAVEACRMMERDCQVRDKELSSRLEATQRALNEAIHANRQKQIQQQLQAERELVELRGQFGDVERSLHNSEEKNAELLQQLDNLKAQQKSMDDLECRLTSILAKVQEASNIEGQPEAHCHLPEKLDEVLGLIQSSMALPQQHDEALKGLESRLKLVLGSIVSGVQQSAAAQTSLEQNLKRIEQTLHCEINTMRQTHSAREAEMRHELMAKTEEKTKLMADLAAERTEVQRLLSLQKKQEEEIDSLTSRATAMDTALATATRSAAQKLEQLHTECKEKDRQLGELQEAMRVENENHCTECEELNQQIENALRESEASRAAEKVSQAQQSDLGVQIEELKASRDQTSQHLSGVKGELSHLQAISTTTAANMRRQLDIAEQRIVNLTQRLKGSPPSSTNAVTSSMESTERTIQQLEGMRKYLIKLADDTADVKEMEALLRSLVEVQAVLLTTQESCVNETLLVEKLQPKDHQASANNSQDESVQATAAALSKAIEADFLGEEGPKEDSVCQTSTQMTTPPDKQVVLRTPSRDGEMPGAAMVAPARERMNRRMVAPDRPILRATKNEEVADSQSSSQVSKEPTSQTALVDPFSGSQHGHRAFSKPVEGKSEQSWKQRPRGQGAVHSIRTKLVGRAAPEKDTLTPLTSWKSEAQETLLLAGPKHHSEDGKLASRKREDNKLETAPRQRDPTEDEAVERERKRLRTHPRRTRSQGLKGMPPSNQQQAWDA